MRTTILQVDPDRHVTSIDLVKDEDLSSGVLKIIGQSDGKIHIATAQKHPICIRLPFLIMIVKNLELHWSFEIEVSTIIRKNQRTYKPRVINIANHNLSDVLIILNIFPR